MSTQLISPVLERTILKRAREVAARITERDRDDAEAEIAQELRRFALDLYKNGNYTGANNAEFETYAYMAVRYHAWRYGGQLQSPVRHPRNKTRDAWFTKSARPPQTGVDRELDPIDRLESECASGEERLLQREMVECVHHVLERQPKSEVVTRVLLGGETMESVARDMNLHFGSVRKAVERGRRALARDPRLRALVAG